MRTGYLIIWTIFVFAIGSAATFLALRGYIWQSMPSAGVQQEGEAPLIGGFREINATVVEYLGTKYLVYTDTTPSTHLAKVFYMIGKDKSAIYFFSAYMLSGGGIGGTSVNYYTYYRYSLIDGKLFESGLYSSFFDQERYAHLGERLHPDVPLNWLVEESELYITMVASLVPYVDFLEDLYGFDFSDVYYTNFYSGVMKGYSSQPGPGEQFKTRYEPSEYFIPIDAGKSDALWGDCSTDLTCYYEKAKEEQPICARIPLFVDQNATTDGEVLDHCNEWLKEHAAPV